MTSQNHKAEGERTEKKRHDDHSPIRFAQAPNHKYRKATDKGAEKHGYQRSNPVSISLEISDSWTDVLLRKASLT